METDLGVIWSLRHSYIVKLCSRRVWKLIISYRYEVAVSSNMWILKSFELHRDLQWKCETHLHKQPWFDKIHSVPCSTLHSSLISSFQSSLALQYQKGVHLIITVLLHVQILTVRKVKCTFACSVLSVTQKIKSSETETQQNYSPCC